MVARKCGRKHFPKEQPKLLKEGGYQRNDKFFRWTLAKCIWEHQGWESCRDLKFFAEHIIAKLQEYETQMWREILSASGGKAEGHGNNNHFIAINKLPKPELKQFIRHGYGEIDDRVFSLRLTGKERLIGLVDLNVFNVLWFDANHEFF